MSPEAEKQAEQTHPTFYMVELTMEWSSGVWEVFGLLKKPCCGTRYSSASTAFSMSSPLIRLRYNLLSVGLGRCMQSSPWNRRRILTLQLHLISY